MENGWIKLHRKAIENDIMKDRNAWALFCWLMLKANRDTGEVKVARIWVCEELAMKKTTYYYSLNRLVKKYKIVNAIPNAKYTTITLLNWAKYQRGEDVHERLPERSMNATRTLPERSTTLYKNRELRIKKEEDSVLSLTTRQLEKLKTEYPNADVDTLYQKFREWQRSEGRIFKNVYARFRMWLIDDDVKGKREKIVRIDTEPVKKKIYTFDEKEQRYYVTEE